MPIPTDSNYPVALDTDDTLFLVHDSLRVRLAQDYNPGDTTIYVEGDPVVFRKFPGIGIITLTEQCSDDEHKAVAFYYDQIDYANFTIGNLQLLHESIPKDSVKPKRITNVTQNVMAEHHNLIKDALIAIETFVGVKGTTDTSPLGPTMEGRINFLRKLVLSPKAYFAVDRTIGLVPLTVTFTDLSFRLGTDEASDDANLSYLWDFGDNTFSNFSNISNISNISGISITSNISFTSPSNAVISGCSEDVLVLDPDGGTITKTYCVPGIYDVSLRVTNAFGSDTITLPGLINARVDAPEPAVVEYFPQSSQFVLPDTGVFDPDTGDYTPPVIRAPINTLITMKVPPGLNPNNPGRTYGGEAVTMGGSVIDPIESYTWVLGDDLNHPTVNSSTKASYGVGGLYDLKLRVDTEFGAYRITTYQDSLDIVETQNLWMFNYVSQTKVSGFEFGLISETFKTMPGSSFIPGVDPSFLAPLPNSAQMTQEFVRNTGFVPSSNVPSGNGGNSLLFYASGRAITDPIGKETVQFVGYNGFAQTFDQTVPNVNRPWNWANFNSSTNAYFLFGSPLTTPGPNSSPVNPALTQYNIQSSAQITSQLTATRFSNGADELLSNPAVFDAMGNNTFGNFSTYRTAWKNNTGYILRNDNVGDFFRIRSFYKTVGTLGSPVQTITKLSDMPGPTKLEGELLTLSPGLFFFNNTGSISAYNDVGGVWETSGGVGGIQFRALQDQTVPNFDDPAQTLVAVSDNDKRVFLSFDYSTNAFVSFSANTLTFSTLSSRIPGVQLLAGLY